MKIINRRVCGNEPLGYSLGKSVDRDTLIADNKNIGYGRVATALIIDKLLQGHQIVDENLVGGIQGQRVSNVFCLSNGALIEADAVSVRNDHGYYDPAADNQ